MAINAPQSPKQKRVVIEQPDYTDQIIEYPSERRRTYYGDRVAMLIRLAFNIVNWIIMLRILFKFIGAAPTQPIARAVYAFTDPIVSPFFGIVTNPTFQTTSDVMQVIEITSLIAVIILAVAGGALAQFIRALMGKPKTADKSSL
jgi:YggT family protein